MIDIAAMLAFATALQLNDPGTAIDQRSILPVEWEEVARIGSVDGHAISPLYFDGDEDQLVFFDWIDRRTKAIALDGSLLWTLDTPEPGGGPVRSISDISLASDGTYLLADMANGEVLEVSPGGSLVRSMEMPGTRRIAGTDPLTDALVAWTDKSARALDATSHEGVPLWHVPLPANVLAVHPLAREVELGSALSGSVILVGFRMASALFRVDLLNPGRPMSKVPTPESVPFAETLAWDGPDGGEIRRVHPSATVSTTAITSSKVHFYVLFEGRTADAGRLVDRYRVEDGGYEGTLVLPARALHIQVIAPRVIAAVVRDPLPEFRVWRWRFDAAVTGGKHPPGGQESG